MSKEERQALVDEAARRISNNTMQQMYMLLNAPDHINNTKKG